MKSPLSVDHVTLELSNVFLTIDQIKSTLSFFKIFNKISFIFFPMLLEIVKIVVIKLSFKFGRNFIVNTSFPIEGVFCPLTFISKLFWRIVEFSKAVHGTIFPLAIIDASIVVAKPPVTMPQTTFLLPNIYTVILVLFCNYIIIWLLLLFNLKRFLGINLIAFLFWVRIIFWQYLNIFIFLLDLLNFYFLNTIFLSILWDYHICLFCQFFLSLLLWLLI